MTRIVHMMPAWRRPLARIGCVLLILLGIVGIIRNGVLPGDRVFFDFKVFYAAGDLCRERVSPYDVTRFWAELSRFSTERPEHNRKLQAIYVYPPQASAFFALRLFGEPSALASAAVALASVGVVAGTAWVLRQAPRTEQDHLLDFAIVSTLSAVVIYHRTYDLFLLFRGFLCLCLRAASDVERHGRWLWARFLVAFLLQSTRFNGRVTGWVSATPGLRGPPQARALLPMPWLVMAMLLTLLQLRRSPAALAARQLDHRQDACQPAQG